MNRAYQIEPVAECSILIVFEQPASSATSQMVRSVCEELSTQFTNELLSITPSYRTILLDYLPQRITQVELCSQVASLLERLKPQPPHSDDILVLPAYYDAAVGPDLALYFERGLSLDTVIRLHSETIYTVGAIGFAPGFAFLTEVNEQLALPRKATPRLSLPKGSIAIAERQTAVYPDASPGGWNVIGNCPISLYSPDDDPMIPFTVGQRVRFVPIKKTEFLALGGVINEEAFA